MKPVPRISWIRLLGALMCGACISIFAGCAQKQPDLSFKEMVDRECRFSRKKLDLNPAEVVEDYLSHDAAGDFTLVSAWFDGATLCPGNEGAPEVSYVIRSTKVGKTDVSQGYAKVQVEYEVIGQLEPGTKQAWNFVMRRQKAKRVFNLVHTRYGWRIRNARLPDGQYLSIDTAKSRVTGVKDRKVLSGLDPRRS